MLDYMGVGIALVGTLVSLFAGVFIFSQNKKGPLGCLFLIFSFFVAALTVANYLSVYSQDSLAQTWSARIVMMAAITLVFLLYVILRHIERQDSWLISHERLLLLITFIMISLTGSDFFIVSVSSSEDHIVTHSGQGIVLFLMYFIVMLLLSISRLARGVVSSRPKNRAKYKLLIAGLAPVVVLAPITSIVLPVIYSQTDFIPLSPAYIIVFLCFMGYAIIRHGLFDIRLAAIRTAGYALTIGTLAVVYVILAYAMSHLFFGGNSTHEVSFSPVNVIIALALTVIFQPIKQFFDQFTNRIFYRGQYDQGVFFREFGKILSYDTDLRLLLRQVSKYIVDNLRAEKTFFNISGRGVFGAAGLKGVRVHRRDMEAIDRYYRDHYEFPSVMVYGVIESQEIRDIFKLYSISMVLPLVLQGQAIGHLFIGEHKSRGYTMRDVRVIESVANELAIAVQNSLSVEEIRELNESLQTKVDTATKELRASNRQLQKLDEAKNDFMSIASHQLRTPLTSIKGYLDMMLQGDLGRVTPTQRAVLSEAYVSSERMVALINDFLNASRLQTGKFVIERTDGDLREIVSDQVKMLRVVAKQYKVSLRLSVDKKVPVMRVDVDKIRQVVQNFIDNAIYYSAAGKIIYISLGVEGSCVVFKVEDTGIGVPAAEQPALFTRFFRASNARQRRPDGTGIGLYLAKKIVGLHGGSIIFDSSEGRGSTFGFKLPVK